MEIELRGQVRNRLHVLLKIDLWTLMLHSMFMTPLLGRQIVDGEKQDVIREWLRDNHVEDLHLFADGKEVERPATWDMED